MRTAVCWPTVPYQSAYLGWLLLICYWNCPKHWSLGKGRRMWWWSRKPCQKSCFLWSEKAHVKHRRTLASLGERQVLNTRIKPLRPSAQSAGQAFVWDEGARGQPWVLNQPRATHEGKKVPVEPKLDLVIKQEKLIFSIIWLDLNKNSVHSNR